MLRVHLQAISAGLAVVPFAVPGLAVLGLPHEDVIITPTVIRHVQQHHISQQQQTETRNKIPGQAADQDSSACFHSETVSVFAARCSPLETAIKSNIFDSRFLTACEYQTPHFASSLHTSYFSRLPSLQVIHVLVHHLELRCVCSCSNRIERLVVFGIKHVVFRILLPAACHKCAFSPSWS